MAIVSGFGEIDPDGSGDSTKSLNLTSESISDSCADRFDPDAITGWLGFSSESVSDNSADSCDATGVITIAFSFQSVSDSSPGPCSIASI